MEFDINSLLNEKEFQFNKVALREIMITHLCDEQEVLRSLVQQ